jgi:hypothetical protein
MSNEQKEAEENCEWREGHLEFGLSFSLNQPQIGMMMELSIKFIMRNEGRILDKMYWKTNEGKNYFIIKINKTMQWKV